MPSLLAKLLPTKQKQNPYQLPQHHAHKHGSSPSTPCTPTLRLRPISPTPASNFLAEARIASNRHPITGRPASLLPGQGRTADGARAMQRHDEHGVVADHGTGKGDRGGRVGCESGKTNGGGMVVRIAEEYYAPEREWVGEFYGGGRPRAG